MGFAFQRTATPIVEQPANDAPTAGSASKSASNPSAPNGPGPGGETRACDWLLAWYDRHRVFYLALLVLFYIAGFNGTWRPEPDSALYLSIGRNLAEGDGYTYNGMPHGLAYPGMPYLNAVFSR